MNVVAYDPYASAEKALAMGVHMVSFEDALRYECGVWGVKPNYLGVDAVGLPCH